jgi:amidohydrolase
MQRAQALHDEMVEWRRAIHMHPELGFEETRTAQLVANTLRELGLRVETGIGKTGVVARLGEGPPAVGIRADMDALEVEEANEVPYASQVPGVMHACGHDAHVAVLLGAAKLMTTLPDRPPGEVRFLFQPCEEGWDSEGQSGAPRMIAEGALEGLDAAIALHVDAGAPAGNVGVRNGYAMAAVDPFSATITGAGCHSSAPHQGVNPIPILAQVINAIERIRASRIDPLESAVIVVETVHGGTSTGVVPQEVHLSGNMRSYDDATRHQLWEELEAAMSIARSLGGDYELSIMHYSPALHNDPDVVAVIRQVIEDLVGADKLYVSQKGLGGEDFGYMIREVPGAMFRLGTKIENEHRPTHSPIFDVDESAFPVGAAVLVETAHRLLRAHQ